MNGQAIAFRGPARKRALAASSLIAQNAFLLVPGRKVRLIDHEARPQRQPRIKRAQRDVCSGGNRLTQKVQHESCKLDGMQVPLLRLA